jgi:hypothetical protein
MITTSDQAYRMRCRLGGLRRAEFWRKLGFPNLIKARELLRRKQAEARKLIVPEEMSATQRSRYEYEWTPEQRAEVGAWRKLENSARSTCPIYEPDRRL